MVFLPGSSPGYTAYTFALSAFGHWGSTFLHRAHGVAVDKAGEFFGAVLVVAGLVGTMIGGLAATAWQRRNHAGYAWTLGLSVLVAVPLAFGAFLAVSTFWSMSFLARAARRFKRRLDCRPRMDFVVLP